MMIEYRPTATGGSEINTWTWASPYEMPYLHAGTSYSVMMVPGFEDFWS